MVLKRSDMSLELVMYNHLNQCVIDVFDLQAGAACIALCEFQTFVRIALKEFFG
jgi:hypothetical protein